MEEGGRHNLWQNHLNHIYFIFSSLHWATSQCGTHWLCYIDLFVEWLVLVFMPLWVFHLFIFKVGVILTRISFNWQIEWISLTTSLRSHSTHLYLTQWVESACHLRGQSANNVSYTLTNCFFLSVLPALPLLLLLMHFLKLSRPILSLEALTWLLSLVPLWVSRHTLLYPNLQSLPLQSFCFNASSTSKTIHNLEPPTLVCVGERAIAPFDH